MIQPTVHHGSDFDTAELDQQSAETEYIDNVNGELLELAAAERERQTEQL